MKKNEKQNLYKNLSFGICLTLLIISAIILFMPIINFDDYSITPWNFMESSNIETIDFGHLKPLTVMFYICKYFYMIFAFIILAELFFLLFYYFTNHEKLHQKCSIILSINLVFIFVSLLIGFNFVNIYDVLKQSASLTLSGSVFFIFGIILFFCKIIVDFCFGRNNEKEELKYSGSSLIMSFTVTFFTICALFFPLYIFPGTAYRMRGIDLFLKVNDVFASLPMTQIFKTIIFCFTMITLILFVINIVFYIFKTKIFIFFNRYSSFFGLLALVVYALIGLNYMIVYVDGEIYTSFLNSSMNTYSYMPLLMVACFWMGLMIMKSTFSKLKIEYKVYAQPQDIQSEEISTIPNGRPEQSAEEEGIADPIPAFTELDLKSAKYQIEFREKMGKNFTDVSLPKLVEHIIQYAKFSEDHLSYGAVEIKTFIAGLAASKLSILQGMSGTGKTSLPKIFMESIDGICELVAVESSWRDKSELIGFYSEFKKKFTPKTFTQFLYKATLNKDIPYFIVLDEMNLSRIEYYFSDFLSIMEARENMRSIKLFDIQLYPHTDNRKEYSGLRDGHTIDIPKNIWFIGTANRDESTFEISDKVYDRAQTMNFDKRASKIYVAENRIYPKKFVTYTQLRKLFDETKSIGFDAEKNDIIRLVEDLLRPYNISFGNRILKQMEDFVNAYVACSEISSATDRDKYIHEALDCILFSKVVKKLEFKQILDIETLIEEFEELKLTKCLNFLNTLEEIS